MLHGKVAAIRIPLPLAAAAASWNEPSHRLARQAKDLQRPFNFPLNLSSPANTVSPTRFTFYFARWEDGGWLGGWWFICNDKEVTNVCASSSLHRSSSARAPIHILDGVLLECDKARCCCCCCLASAALRPVKLKTRALVYRRRRQFHLSCIAVESFIQQRVGGAASWVLSPLPTWDIK